jgi:regulator of protease activity HflC (stomatin/prohibitin superfamily)
LVADDVEAADHFLWSRTYAEAADQFLFEAIAMNLLGIALLVVLLALVLLTATRSLRATIFEYERGLRFRRGRFARVLDPGVYWHLPAFTRIQRVDVRPTRVAVAGQEVLSADGVAVKASLAATYRIVDPQRAILATDDYRTAVYTELQLALRAIVSETTVEDLLQQRAEMSARLKAIPAEKLAAIGVELQDAAVRDLTFPGELKKIFAQVVKARQEGLAALERARGETAALRNLANAAQMIERSPSLIQLRLLQVLAQQPGNTLVLGVQQQGTPIPLRSPAEAELPPPAPPEAE